MPNYKSNKKHFKKAKKTMYSKAKKYGAVIQKSLGGVPPSTIVKIKWTRTSLVMAPNATPSRFSDQFVHLNDPTQNQTVTPQGWNTYINLYNKFLVEACSIKNVFTNTSLTIPQRVYCIPVMDASVPTYSQSVVTQLPHAKMRYISVQTGGKDCVTLKNYISVSKMVGQKVTPEADNYWGFTGSSNSQESFNQPNDLMYWRFGTAVTSVSNIDAAYPIYVDQEITYYVRFFDRLQGSY